MGIDWSEMAAADENPTDVLGTSLGRKETGEIKDRSALSF
jgi:hypothetical protein